MCGIVGVLRYGDLGDKDNRHSALYLATTLLELTETRGKDATGIAALFDDGNFFGQKMALRASEFVTRFGGNDGDFDGLQAVLRDYEGAGLRTIIGHCRKSSVGGKWDNVNNHPIKAGNIIGIHNGTLKNQDVIFDNLKCDRDGTVDSEAIMRLLQYYTKNCKDPFTLEMLEEVFRRLEGSFSVLAFNANNPSQLVSARDGRPAEYCLIKPLKMVVIASEKKIIETAVWTYNKLAWNHRLPGFRKLKSADVEFALLPDDTVALFDLTREITEETKLADLYDTKKLPFAAQRIWKTPTKTTTYNSGTNTQNGRWNRNNAGTGNTTNKAADDDTKEDKKSGPNTSTATTSGQTDQDKSQDTKGGQSGNKSSSGLAWNNSLESYCRSWGKRDENKGHTIINTEKKRVMSITEACLEFTKDSRDSALEKDTDDTVTIELDDADGLDVRKSSVERFKDNKKSNEINMVKPKGSTEQKDVPAPKNGDKGAALALLKSGADKGAAETADTKNATKAAIEAVKGIQKFSSEDEVATMCSTDVESLRKLPLDALANRIMIHHFATFFKAGYMTKCATLKEDRKEMKFSNQRKHIRVLKGVTALFGGIMSEEIPEGRTTDWFKSWFDSKLFGELTPENLKDVFNTGDLRNNKTVRELVNTLDNTEE